MLALIRFRGHLPKGTMSEMGSRTATRCNRRRFSEEFKAGAVRLVKEKGKSVGAVARELDLTPVSARPLGQARAGGANEGQSGLMKEERQATTHAA